jgi:hypothetical protein
MFGKTSAMALFGGVAAMAFFGEIAATPLCGKMAANQGQSWHRRLAIKVRLKKHSIMLEVLPRRYGSGIQTRVEI